MSTSNSVKRYRIARRVIRQATNFFPFLYSLDLLAFKHGTDKRKHGYIEHYVSHLQGLRHRSLKLMEIGVKTGASLKMWKDYFYRSMIYGIDIEYSKQYDERRIKTFQGSQNDSRFLCEVIEETGPPDIIIDDGSHMNEHVVTSFETLFPLLAENGWYIIEDLQTAYWKSFGGDANPESATYTSIKMLKRLIDGLTYEWIPDRDVRPNDTTITAMHFYPKVVFIRKGRNQERYFTQPELAQIREVQASSGTSN